jgi:hypothetical protein
MLPTQSQKIIFSNMRKATLRILKSLYSKADLDAAGEGFVATCTEDEEIDLVQGFLKTAT